MSTDTNTVTTPQPASKPRRTRDGRPMPEGRPFQKGVSGNPNGRRNVPYDVRVYCETFSKEACDALVEIIRDKTAAPASRLAAAEQILNRAHGRPRQAVDVSGEINFGVDFNVFVRKLIMGDAAETIGAEPSSQLIEATADEAKSND